jgi:predicted metal-dependent hydrolase
MDITIKRSRRRRTLALSIEPPGRVIVHAPAYVWPSWIERFIHKQTAWIDKKLAQFKDHSYPPLPVATRESSRQLVEERLRISVPRIAAAMAVTPQSVAVSHQKSRWGSCTSTGVLRFSSRLAAIPSDVFDYVVIHEIAHMKVFNHSRRFWQVVEKQCPQYRSHRAWLRRHGWKATWLD